jgi:1-deoxy-D-xylulose-5-phosphate reductoisomerase
MKKKIAILGSTGSIGKSLINIIKKDKKNFDVILLSANNNTNELLKQVKLFNVKNIIITNKDKFDLTKKMLIKKKINIYNDFKSIEKIFKNKKIHYTMNAITGLDGLDPTLRIIRFTQRIAIANKESIICAWNLIKRKLNYYKTDFIPVDSEHFSIWSLIDKNKVDHIDRVFITASGGPFNNLDLKKFKSINKEQALKHPNWSMGKKITIDSATMMNKIFEIIEAKNIFNLKYKNLSIIVHPKSYVHAIVKFNNGLIKILLHDTNMTIPIFNSLYSNNEKKIKSKNLNIDILNNLNLQNIDKKKFPVIKILKFLPDELSLFETVIVSANDKLVDLFLKNKIHYLDISRILLKIIRNKDFTKFKDIKPRNIKQINKINKDVHLKIDSLSI